MQDVVQSENPNLAKSKVFSKCGEIWKTLDQKEKEKYDKIFKQLQEKYDAEILKFQASLSDEQKNALAEYESAKQTDKIIRKKRKARIF